MVSPAPSWTITPVQPTMTETLQPAASVTLTPTQPLPTPTPSVQVCSPLSGYSLEQLPEIVSNPFNPPPPGSDNPHQGVDLADRLAGSGIATAGMPVQDLLPGKIILAQSDRFPYGSAVIVETRLQDLPVAWRDLLPQAAAPWTPDPALTCPAVPQPDWQDTERSVYILYAHLQAAPLVQIGEEAACGQALGAVGQSGNALVPHLHLEIRVGPSSWQPGEMAHYTNDARPGEMGQYCTWRVSGIFQWVDPLKFLANIYK